MKNLPNTPKILRFIGYTANVSVWVSLFWYFSDVVLYLEMGEVKLPDYFISESLLYGMTFNAAVFYLNYYFLIDRFLPKRIAQYFIISFILVLLITLVESAFDLMVLSGENYQSQFDLFLVLLWFNIKVHGIFWLASGVFKTIINWITQESVKEKIKAQHTEAELALLKSQVHPHFLFNTLNTLYSSAYEFGDKETADGIGKLSHLLRYMLYETKEAKVLLESEIEHIENYIELQKMRFSKEVDVSFTIDGDYQDIKIAPMLFINIIENAFKHGVSPSTKSEIRVKLSIIESDIKEDKTVVFNVVNTRLNTRAKSILEGNAGGLGLENLSKRLELLYPGTYRFTTQMMNDQFITNLELPCS